MIVRRDQWLSWAPEIGLAALALFFAYRELGMFPVSWIDEGLFVMTAKTLAAGHGYALPILDQLWYTPYFLAVGPTVILPAAASLKLFGLSLAAARLPMTIYLLGTCVVMYVFTKRIAGTAAARWTTLLLVTLSAFVNTGKPVLGEVPAFFFLLLGVSMMHRAEPSVPWSIGAGAAFGLSVMSKLTFGFVFPALGILWCIALVKRGWRAWKALTIILCVALAIYVPWYVVEFTAGGRTIDEILLYISSGIDQDIVFLNVVRRMPEILLRLPYLAYGAILVLGGTGLVLAGRSPPQADEGWRLRSRLPWTQWWFIVLLIACFTFYMLNLYGWYRHVLPAHLLLLPFVPAGTERIAGKKLAVIILSLIALAQGIWQFQHRGAGRGEALAETVRIVQEEYAETDLLIEHSEVFAQLPENPHWYFLMRERLSPTLTDPLVVPERLRCYAHLRKLTETEIPAYEKTGRPVGSYWIIPSPELGCPSRL